MIFPFRNNQQDLIVLRNGPVELRPPALEHFDAWADLRARSHSFLQPYEPAWHSDDLTRHRFKKRVKFYRRAMRNFEHFAFLIFTDQAIAAPTGSLVGGITLSHLRRGVTQSATLGYWIGAPYQRRGFMTAAIKALCRYGFVALKLHRLEACCLTDNLASIQLLEKCGFQREGCARQYLFINNAWRDHYLYALLAEDYFAANDTATPR